MRTALAVLAAVLMAMLLVASCSSIPKREPPGSCRMFVVAPEFTAEEHAALQRSLDRWNDRAAEPFCMRDATASGEAENTEHGVFRIAYHSPYWYEISKNVGGANFIGIHWGNTDQIGIVDTLSADTFELVALHEFGHAHGLRHTEPPSIMCAFIGTATDFTENDDRECRRVGACSSETAIDLELPSDCVMVAP